MLIIKTEQKDNMVIVKAEILNIEYTIGTIERVNDTHFVAYDYDNKRIGEYDSLNKAKDSIIKEFKKVLL